MTCTCDLHKHISWPLIAHARYWNDGTFSSWHLVGTGFVGYIAEWEDENAGNVVKLLATSLNRYYKIFGRLPCDEPGHDPQKNIPDPCWKDEFPKYYPKEEK